MVGVAVSCAHPRVVDESRLTDVMSKRSESTHSFLWGFVRDEYKLTDKMPATEKEFSIGDGAIQYVSYRQSVLESLAAVATLGIWMPGRVEWALSASDLRPPTPNTRRQHDFDVPQQGRVGINLSSQATVSFHVVPTGSPDRVVCDGDPRSGGHMADCPGLSAGSYFIYVEARDGGATYDLVVDQAGTKLLEETNAKIDPFHR